jgi:hypothetical protein
MGENQKLTIITRTSTRPNQFSRLVQSIAKQSYKNIFHLVLCDNAAAYEYVSDTLIAHYHTIGLQFAIHNVFRTSKNPGFYNLYLNYGIGQVNNGYIIIIDDDNYLTDHTCIERFWNKTKPDDGFYIVQYLRGERIKPKSSYFHEVNYKAGNTSPIMLGKIDSSCAIFQPKHADNALWDDQLASDYRFIKQLAANNNYTFIPMPLVQTTPTGNKGVPNDHI